MWTNLLWRNWTYLSEKGLRYLEIIRKNDIWFVVLLKSSIMQMRPGPWHIVFQIILILDRCTQLTRLVYIHCIQVVAKVYSVSRVLNIIPWALIGCCIKGGRCKLRTYTRLWNFWSDDYIYILVAVHMQVPLYKNNGFWLWFLSFLLSTIYNVSSNENTTLIDPDLNSCPLCWR